MITEYCLIPRPLVEKKILTSNEKEKNENEISVSRKEITKLPYKSPTEYRSSLKELITKSISKNKIDKAISLHNWLLENVQGLEYLKDGQLLSPIKGLNLIQFIKDVFSNKRVIPEKKTNIYRLFSSITSLPEYFIDNKFLKSKLYPNYDEKIDNNITSEPRKRKLDSPSPVRVSKKIREKIENKGKNDYVSSEDEEKVIDKYYEEHVETPKRILNLRPRIAKKGGSKKKKKIRYVTTKKPSLNEKSWIHYH